MAAANKILIGSETTPLFTFTDSTMRSINAEMSVNVIGQELSADSIEFEVTYDDTAGTLRALDYATKIFYYRQNTSGGSWILVAKFYLTQVKRIAKNQYTIYGTSFVGLLEYESFYGGMYFGRRLNAVINDLFLAKGVEKYNRISHFLSTYQTGGSEIKGVKIASSYICDFRARVQAQFQLVKLHNVSGFKIIFGSYSNYTQYGGRYGIGLSVTSSSRTLVFYCGDNVYTIYDDNRADTDAEPYGIREGDIITINCFLLYPPFRLTVQRGNRSKVYEWDPGNVSNPAEAVDIAVWGGGIRDGSPEAHNQEIAYKYYRVQDVNENPLIDVAALADRETGAISLRNLVSGYTASDPYAMMVSGNDIIAGGSEYPDTVSGNPLANELISSVSYEDNIEDLFIYGWIPAGSKRDALYQILFANCINLVKTDSGFSFKVLSNESAGSIAKQSIYDTGDVDQLESVNVVELKEHSYSGYQASQEIYNNSEDNPRSGEYYVLFNNAPIYGTPVAGEGITILGYNCNAALVTGKGIITGTPYQHGEKIIESQIGTKPTGKTISVTDATMITSVNSSAVMSRLVEYYQNAYQVNNSIVFHNVNPGDPLERCGSKYSFYDCFNEAQSGFLEHMALVISQTIKANCEFVCGYTVPPTRIGYKNKAILTGSGSWSVPSGVTSVHVILIGGGQGGYSGYAGEAGGQPASSSYDVDDLMDLAAKGGNYGASGSPGKVYELDYNVSGLSTISYSCGSGGSGGATCSSHTISNAGSNGTNTTFGSKSSSSGSSSDRGITDVFTGEMYAYKPSVWSEESGPGGRGSIVQEIVSGQTTAPNYSFPGNAYNVINQISYVSDFRITGIYIDGGGEWIVTTGAPGGAAFQFNSDASVGGNYVWDHPIHVRGGNGGAGGDANYIPPKPAYGCGGIGGVGGGGGGSAGAVNPDYATSTQAVPGAAGKGGQGGSGGDGCIIIYY